MNVKVKAIIKDQPYVTTVQAGEHTITVDEPLALGGANKGMNPFELLASALASCSAATLRMYLIAKKWETGPIEVEVEMIPNEKTGATVFNRTVHFIDSELSLDQIERLLSIVQKCPVHKVLSATSTIHTQIK